MGEHTEIAWTEETKVAARSAVNVEVRLGRLPRPNDLPCVDCGHVWSPGERRHEYDHHAGYARPDWLNVEVVCTVCHRRRDQPPPSHCKRGHRFTVGNTKYRRNGTRECRECRRDRDRKRRTAAWWRARRARKRAEEQHGS